MNGELRMASCETRMHVDRHTGPPCASPGGSAVDGAFITHHSSLITRRASALTLIELLVVMAIMTIIAGSIVVAMVSAIGNAQVKGTKAFFNRIKAQMAQYYDAHRMYIPADPNEKDQLGNLTYSYTVLDLNSVCLWQSLEYEGDLAAKKDFILKSDTFTEPETGQLVTRYLYVDAWRKPIVYVCTPPFKRFEIRSGGKDLNLNTDDDLVVTD